MKFNIALKFAVCVFLIFSPNIYSQSTDFEKWKNEQQNEFQEYKNELDLEFAQRLENLWIELDINRASILFKSPKPEILPVFDGDFDVDEKSKKYFCCY